MNEVISFSFSYRVHALASRLCGAADSICTVACCHARSAFPNTKHGLRHGVGKTFVWAVFFSVIRGFVDALL